jgi:hypothetical protein
MVGRLEDRKSCMPGVQIFARGMSEFASAAFDRLTVHTPAAVFVRWGMKSGRPGTPDRPGSADVPSA